MQHQKNGKFWSCTIKLNKTVVDSFKNIFLHWEVEPKVIPFLFFLWQIVSEIFISYQLEFESNLFAKDPKNLKSMKEGEFSQFWVLSTSISKIWTFVCTV